MLTGIDLDVHRGEILVLLGGSGSGKTTLLKQVLGLAKPDTGSIRINGVDITSCSSAELATVRRRIGVAFQASALFNSLSVEDNVALPLQELTELADSTIATHGLDEAEGGRSGGRGPASPSRAVGRYEEARGDCASHGAGSGPSRLRRAVGGARPDRGRRASTS